MGFTDFHYNLKSNHFFGINKKNFPLLMNGNKFSFEKSFFEILLRNKNCRCLQIRQKDENDEFFGNLNLFDDIRVGSLCRFPEFRGIFFTK